ncbi:MAG: type I restriction endonuclease subunit R, partial [Salinivirgaceae bacterium]|nr:type I restriction endonuclease subunit R [Salinivirgaceae bacterium]
MTKLLESDIEQMLIEQLKAKGYNYLYGPDIAPDGETPMRGGFDEVVLRDKLEAAVRRLNPSLPAPVLDEAVKAVLRIGSPDILANNEEFHRLLTEGVPVSVHKDGAERGERVWLIDFNDSWNNEFTVVNQFTIIENGHNRRPDVILFVNGLPLVLFELKNAADENATLQSAFRQIETYKQQIPSLFTYNALVVISDGLEARAGSLSAGFSRFTAWKSDDGESIASSLVSELEVLVNGMLRKDTLLDIIGSFIVFEKQKQDDLKTGLTTIKTIKKIAAYHQYYAVNKAVESTIRATGVNQTAAVSESPANYGFKTVQQQEIGDHRAGVVWHT